MLLIAQPKSASTSLCRTIARIGGLQWKVGIPRTKHEKNCKGFFEMQRYHNNMIPRSPKFLRQVVCGRKTIFKEHILPTPQHLKILDSFHKQPIVILVRDAQHSANNYVRMKCKNLNVKLLEQNLQDFRDIYINWGKHKPNVLIVDYKDLIFNYDVTVKRILKKYQIKYKKICPLLKYKYTGVGLKRLKKNNTNKKK